MDELQPITLLYLAVLLLALAGGARHLKQVRRAIEREAAARKRAKTAQALKAHYKQLSARRSTHRSAPTPQPWVVVPEHIGAIPPMTACEPEDGDSRAAAVICTLSIPIELLDSPTPPATGGSNVD